MLVVAGSACFGRDAPWRNAKSATNALVENDNMLGTLLMNVNIKKAVYTDIGVMIRHL